MLHSPRSVGTSRSSRHPLRSGPVQGAVHSSIRQTGRDSRGSRIATAVVVMVVLPRVDTVPLLQWDALPGPPSKRPNGPGRAHYQISC